MIGTLGEKYAGIVRYGMTDTEIFENLDNNHNHNTEQNLHFSSVSPKPQKTEGLGDNDVLNSLDSFTDRDFMDAGELEEELVGGVV